MERWDDGSVKLNHTCYACGHAFDAGMMISESQRSSEPEKGDVSFCIKCGAFGIFEAPDQPTRQPTIQEEEEIMLMPEARAAVKNFAELKGAKLTGTSVFTPAALGALANDLIRALREQSTNRIEEQCINAIAAILSAARARETSNIALVMLITTDAEGKPLTISHTPGGGPEPLDVLQRCIEQLQTDRTEHRVYAVPRNPT